MSIGEYLVRGNLNNGTGNAGLSCVNGNNGLANANWNIVGGIADSSNNINILCTIRRSRRVTGGENRPCPAGKIRRKDHGISRANAANLPYCFRKDMKGHEKMV